MKVCIAGGGKVGMYLAQSLLAHRHKVTIIEPQEMLCRSLADSLDIPVICGDAISFDTMRTADVASCDAFVAVTGADESRVIRAAKALRDALGYAVERREELKPLSIEVLGPAGASVVKVNNRYRYRVFLVGKGCPALRRLVAEYLYAFYQHKENRGLDIFADCNAIQ